MVSAARRSAGENIVAVVDSSAESQAALRWALDEAARRGCRVVALSVVDPSLRSEWPLVRDHGSELREEQEHLADRVSRAMTGCGGTTVVHIPMVSLRVRQGRLRDEVARAADGADVLVVGRPLLLEDMQGIRDLRKSCRVVLVDEQGEALPLT